MSATISNLTPAPVRRRGNGCGDGRRGGRDGGGVRRIYHLSSRLTVLPLSAGLCACLRIGETRARLGAVARRVVVVRCRTRRGLPGQTLAFSRTAPVLRHQGCRTLVSPWRRRAPGSAAVALRTVRLPSVRSPLRTEHQRKRGSHWRGPCRGSGHEFCSPFRRTLLIPVQDDIESGGFELASQQTFPFAGERDVHQACDVGWLLNIVVA